MADSAVVKMAKWELYAKQWLEKQFVLQGDEFTTRENKWQLRDLVTTLVSKDIIPDNIKDDNTLYALLVAQTHKIFGELLQIPTYGFLLPNYYYAAQSTRGLAQLNAEKVEELKNRLERETGINIIHYYKIKTVADKRLKTPFIITNTKSGRVTKRRK
jgi:hypothetical protein